LLACGTMAVIHRTTLTPGKLEMLSAWLPTQPWYRDAGRPPELDQAGGFRLDDPDGEVGLEFMAVTDAATGTTYHVPLAYRAHARPGDGHGGGAGVSATFQQPDGSQARGVFVTARYVPVAG
jgi:Maltokinase N-terminal cap domain